MIVRHQSCVPPLHRCVSRSTVSALLLGLVSSFGCGGKTIENEVQANEPASACSNQVGSKPISHACTHTTNGPFENVVAADSADTAPKVDAVHVSYLVELSEEMGTGNIVFTPSRDGEHLLLLDAEVPFTVSRGTKKQDPVFGDSLEGCDTATYGEVYTLSAGEHYVIEFTPNGHSPTLLFFEHLATFGKGAWTESCHTGE